MNTYLFAAVPNAWLLAGWTMIHFLWLGALVALAAFVARLLLRRASANVRYATSLTCLTVLAALPVGIALQIPLPPREGSGEGSLLHPVNQSNSSPAPARIDLKLLEQTATIARTPTAPGSAGGFVQHSSTNPQFNENPRQSRGLPARSSLNAESSFELLKNWVPYLPWVWLVGAPITFLLLATGIVGTRRLRRESHPIDDGPIAALLVRLIASLRIGKHVTVAVCDRIAAPVLIGILRPIILLPPAALTGYSPDEIEMVLLHELAHVRRWDNLINLFQRLIESLLFFHPAVWLLSNWVRREREACCDAMVVSRTHEPHAYAELLLNLSARMSEPGRPRPRLYAAFTAMAAGPLRSRIRHILGLDDDPMLISGKSFALVLGTLITAAALAVLYLPKIGQAEQSATEGMEDIEKSAKPTSPTNAQPANNTAEETAKPKAKQTGPVKVGLSPKSRLMPLSFALKRDESGKTKLYLNGQPVADDVVRLLVADHLKIDSDAHASLSADKGIPYSEVMRVVDLLESLHLKKLSLDTRQIDPKTKAATSADGSLSESSPAHGEKTSSKFPSLEDQKLADQAWKQIKLELEPIGEADLKRVKALGYVGGLKVISSDAATQQSTISPEDILVGLHVWPTISMKDVAKILDRDDLAELNPLKFYVIHSQQVGAKEQPSGAAPEPIMKDFIRTGRVSVNPTTPPSAPSPSVGATSSQENPYELYPQKTTTQPISMAEQGRILEIQRAEQLLKDLSQQIESATKAKQEALKQREQAKEHDAVEAAKHELDDANRRLDGLKRSSEEVKREYEKLQGENPSTAIIPGPPVADYAFPVQPNVPQHTFAGEERDPARLAAAEGRMKIAAERVEAATNAKQKALETRLEPISAADAAEGATAEAAKRELEKADRQLEDAKRMFESAKRQVEELQRPHGAGTSNAEPSSAPNAGLVSPGLSTTRAQTSPAAAAAKAPQPNDHSLLVPNPKTPFANAPRAAEPSPYSVRPQPNVIVQNAPHQDELRSSSPHSQSPGNTATDKSALRYDGKTFDKWQTAWRTELSTAKRLEAVKALAAFGASGYGREAAEAILDVADQYDWTPIPTSAPAPPTPAKAAEDELMSAVYSALGGGEGSMQIDPKYWLPPLIERLKSSKEDSRLVSLSKIVIPQIGWPSTPNIDVDALLKLARGPISPARNAALLALAAIDINHQNPRITARFQELVRSDSVPEVCIALQTLSSVHAAQLPGMDWLRLLLHPDASVRACASRAFAELGTEYDPKLIQSLQQVLQDPKRDKDHRDVIRLLALTGPQAADSYALFEKLMKDSKQPLAIRVAATNALQKISHDGRYWEQLSEAFVEENKARENTPEFRQELIKFKQAVEDEKQH